MFCCVGSLLLHPQLSTQSSIIRARPRGQSSVKLHPIASPVVDSQEIPDSPTKMPPRGNGGLDFTPLVSHFVFLFTFVIAFAGWWAAFIGQAIATARCECTPGPFPLLVVMLTGVAKLLCTASNSLQRSDIPRAIHLLIILFAHDPQLETLGEVSARCGSQFCECAANTDEPPDLITTLFQ